MDYTLKYLQVKGHHDCNLLSHVPENPLDTQTYVEGK